MRRIAPFFLDMGQKQAFVWTMIGTKSERRQRVRPKPSPSDAFLNPIIPPEGDSRPSLRSGVAA